MSAINPAKKVSAYIQANVIGAVVGAGATYLGTKKFMPGKKWYVTLGVVLLGAYGGAFAQQKIQAKIGSNKSTKETKK